jgi:molecular chaperone GrpE
MGKVKQEKNSKENPNPENVAEEDIGLKTEQEVKKDPSVEKTSEAEVIEISAEEFEAFKKELEGAQAKAAENFDGWQRERADFSNYKKRINREQQQIRRTITGEIIKKYLEVLDDIDRALKNRPTEGSGATWAKGIELISRKLSNIIKSEGITRIPAETELFDPTRHEALSSEESPDHESGEIIEIIQQGYMIGDRVLRPALVRVAR